MSQAVQAKYWQRFLLPGEKLMHSFGVSRRYIMVFFALPAVAFLLAGLGVGADNALLGILLVIPAFGLMMPVLFLWLFVHYAITDGRVMVREGVLHKHFVTVNYRTITDVTVRELFLERIFTRTGTVGVNTAGSNRVELYWRHVARPQDRRRDIYHHLQQGQRSGSQVAVTKTT